MSKSPLRRMEIFGRWWIEFPSYNEGSSFCVDLTEIVALDRVCFDGNDWCLISLRNGFKSTTSASYEDVLKTLHPRDPSGNWLYGKPTPYA